MPLLATAEKIILDEINIENSLSLKPTDIMFGTPSVPTTDDEVKKSAGHNTMVLIQALPGASALGYTTVYYDRLNFNEVFTGLDGNQPLTVPARLDSVQTARDVVPLINHFYGLSLRPDDVVDAAIDRTTWIVELTAMPESLGWLGSINAQLTPGDALIPSNFDPSVIKPYSLPYFNIKVGQANVYGYPYRFDKYAQKMMDFGTGDDPEILAQVGYVLTTVTGDPWTIYRNPLSFNLKEAAIVYNGKNKADLPTNSSYDNVMVIELSLYCLNLGGRLYLHYNDPDQS